MLLKIHQGWFKKEEEHKFQINKREKTSERRNENEKERKENK